MSKKPCNSCKNKKESIQQTIDSELKQIDDYKLFWLRNDIGAIQFNLDNNEFLSRFTTTDEMCINFLRVNPNRISLFEKFPENWKELIKNNENESNNE